METARPLPTKSRGPLVIYFPFTPMNFGMGLTRVRFWDYFFIPKIIKKIKGE